VVSLLAAGVPKRSPDAAATITKVPLTPQT